MKLVLFTIDQTGQVCLSNRGELLFKQLSRFIAIKYQNIDCEYVKNDKNLETFVDSLFTPFKDVDIWLFDLDACDGHDYPAFMIIDEISHLLWQTKVFVMAQKSFNWSQWRQASVDIVYPGMLFYELDLFLRKNP